MHQNPIVERVMQRINANGAAIPALGFGVFRMSEDEVERVVPAAVEAGFRHFDTAQFYKNEGALGRALKKAGVPRDDLFITTKVGRQICARRVRGFRG
jgi:2,5-diketo-D-gluconate reductase B